MGVKVDVKGESCRCVFVGRRSVREGKIGRHNSGTGGRQNSFYSFPYNRWDPAELCLFHRKVLESYSAT